MYASTIERISGFDARSWRSGRPISDENIRRWAPWRSRAFATDSCMVGSSGRMRIVVHWESHACEKPPGRDVITTRALVRRKHMMYASSIDLRPVGTSSMPSRKSTRRRSIIACLRKR